jgi:hypothetical protein
MAILPLMVLLRRRSADMVATVPAGKPPRRNARLYNSGTTLLDVVSKHGPPSEKREQTRNFFLATTVALP